MNGLSRHRTLKMLGGVGPGCSTVGLQTSRGRSVAARDRPDFEKLHGLRSSNPCGPIPDTLPILSCLRRTRPRGRHSFCAQVHGLPQVRAQRQASCPEARGHVRGRRVTDVPADQRPAGLRLLLSSRSRKKGHKCEACHGAVNKMRTVVPAHTFTMGFCLDCHRQRGASVDCVTCHQ